MPSDERHIRDASSFSVTFDAGMICLTIMDTICVKLVRPDKRDAWYAWKRVSL